jgi:heme-degrading monooxygenase HmoA
MIDLLSQPPPAEAIARMAAIDGVQMVPAILASQRGPDGHLGPDAAGAILVLQATFVDEDGFAEFWRAATEMMELLATAPGFIRRYSFADGPLYHLIAFWRRLADAHAFFARDEHQAAMRELFTHRWQYSHFAALWELSTPRDRVIFCQQCDGVTPATAGVCAGCGRELFDPFASVSRVGG